MAKKTMILLIIGVLVLVLGIGGGVMIGLKFFKPANPDVSQAVQPPGPMFPLGDFTVNLADPTPHVARLRITLELSSAKVPEKITDPGWLSLCKDEVIRTLKSFRFNDIRYPEGMTRAQQDLRARLNAILPTVEGDVAIRRVLFEEFMVQ